MVSIRKVDHFGVTPRQIVSQVAQVAAQELSLPHPGAYPLQQSRHAWQLGNHARNDEGS